MPRRDPERPPHRVLGTLDIVPPVMDDADIDPGVRELRLEPQRGGKRAERLVEPIRRKIGQTDHIGGLRQLRLALKRVSGRLDRSGHISQCH